MDCLKNLTACMGCTKKHAKCSWKDVEEQELKDHPFVLRIRNKEEGNSEGEGSRSGGDGARKRQYSQERGVRDEELLGEDTGDEDGDLGEKSAPPVQERRHSSVQSISPPAAVIPKEHVPERMEGLQAYAHVASAIVNQSAASEKGEETANLEANRGPATASPPKLPISDPDIDLIYSTSGVTASPLPNPVSKYQAPEANMQRPNADGATSYTEPNEENVYTRFNTATNEDLPKSAHEELLRFSTADGEPLQSATPATTHDLQQSPDPQVSNSPARDAIIAGSEEKSEPPLPPVQSETFQRPPSPPPSGPVPEMGVQRMGMQT